MAFHCSVRNSVPQLLHLSRFPSRGVRLWIELEHVNGVS
jgi:hypothetical protein